MEKVEKVVYNNYDNSDECRELAIEEIRMSENDKLESDKENGVIENYEPITRESISDELIYKEMNDADYRWYRDEIYNLDRELEDLIVCFARLHLWNGTVNAYKTIGINLNGILSSCGCDNFKVTVKGNQVHFLGSHHDGTNRGIYRMWKQETSGEMRSKLMHDWIQTEGDAFKKDIWKKICRHTLPLGKIVSDVYGW